MILYNTNLIAPSELFDSMRIIIPRALAILIGLGP